ncbi:MAG: Nif3-like dinuclear metal center hexameric protein [Chloroflexota bacterium]|nr:Nif3-like dinuclear metal center hexameric protein [Chloroflexota bacterium]
MPTITLRELAAELDAYVDPRRIPDFAPTGLQVDGGRGGTVVSKVALGVSGNLALFREAAAWGADVVLVHHGLFWASEDPEHDPARALDERRAAFLRDRGMSLIAYHLPLDAHPEVGNNAEIARLLGLADVVHDFGEIPESEATIGVVGRMDPPLPLNDLVARANRVFARPVEAVAGGPEPVGSLAIVSGGGPGLIYAAIERGVDAILTGEGREWIPAVARESGITFLASGHHASEVFGVQALGRWVEARFEVETKFFPQANPF